MQMAYSKMKLQKKNVASFNMYKQKKTKRWTYSDHGLNSIKHRFNSKTVFIYFFFFGGGGDFLKNNPLQHCLKTTICETGACALNQIQNTLLHKNMILKRFLNYSCALLCCWQEKSCSVLSGGRWEELQYSAKKPAWIWAPLFYFSKSWTAQLT